LGRFDFAVLVLQFVSGIGLLAVSTVCCLQMHFQLIVTLFVTQVLVDFVALNLLPQKSSYKSHKYELTDVYKQKQWKTMSKDSLDIQNNDQSRYDQETPTPH
jgi:hypothetical protein